MSSILEKINNIDFLLTGKLPSPNTADEEHRIKEVYKLIDSYLKHEEETIIIYLSDNGLSGLRVDVEEDTITYTIIGYMSNADVQERAKALASLGVINYE